MEERLARGSCEDDVQGMEREVKRMPSNGEALLGRSGERVEGERVLLPARKRTVKRASDEKEDTEELRTKEMAREGYLAPIGSSSGRASFLPRWPIRVAEAGDAQQHLAIPRRVSLTTRLPIPEASKRRR